MSDNNKDLFSTLNKTQSRVNTKESTLQSPMKSKEIISKKSAKSTQEDDYNALSIRVLEGLEPVRLRPGMYIGGTDSKALHHLFAEIIDNAMDEAVAGYADSIEVSLDRDGYITVTDNGRGIPVENHPQMPDKSTLEVIMTQLHSGGKFDGKAYQTAGGLHGVGISVVNALSDDMEVEVARERKLYRQRFSRGIPQSGLEDLGDVYNRRGTRVRFHPDFEIFGEKVAFDPEKIYQMARSKAYLFGGVKIRWTCDPVILEGVKNIPEKAIFHFPNGLKDYLLASLKDEYRVTSEIFSGKTQQNNGHGCVEWAIAWHGGDPCVQSYCNTIPTGEGGTHETGLRQALLRGLKSYAELTGNKRAAIITSDDIMISTAAILSVFIKNPEFVGQTKDRLATIEAQRIVENAIRDPFDHWLANSPQEATKLLDWVIERAEERVRRRQDREISRKTAVRKLRLPGKLADCSQNHATGAELFIVEGDSAGGSAKQARNRANQAILPLRGKILNVASAAHEKMNSSQTISDLILALGCGTRSKYREKDLRYERIIIMTDADVDGAHIASLLITFFFQEMPDLIHQGHLYLAVPPLYRISQGGKVAYARDDIHKDELLKTEFTGKAKIEIGRFKGLGEMRAEQLKETTMHPQKRTLLRISIDAVEIEETKKTVDNLMGTKPEARFRFIQENSTFASNLDI
ncbi:DNA topoisomerase IV subunit B [Bartonella krasnovii]|uniref:DNA topoisomerase 4 subunit B n=1 Tax=Bartonella krasnovii TaxID=2267275 RepID=A0A5B9D1N9_9HYPH|nr:DNA topoisomerase IV subunit B [Bartonella krasnovii]QEE12362.1 DNA topoisomerase IV subunit B [Bartonella krasnovii]UNF29963.1 DNA topoisomerase IV subunit B [Bartonella krasnovii]UNF34838.1 DNA topoisomerase IV subunit B [Bartonella krasnovii]UNF36436.1 DNA topoisomerase IV subunit B [Bartonella krasnovii]UNF38109.1 DNA topoisomerase IV subunit B [Bartonella krasnovii]